MCTFVNFRKYKRLRAFHGAFAGPVELGQASRKGGVGLVALAGGLKVQVHKTNTCRNSHSYRNIHGSATPGALFLNAPRFKKTAHPPGFDRHAHTLPEPNKVKQGNAPNLLPSPLPTVMVISKETKNLVKWRIFVGWLRCMGHESG